MFEPVRSEDVWYVVSTLSGRSVMGPYESIREASAWARKANRALGTWDGAK